MEFSLYPPGVYEVLLTASHFVAVEDEVTVSAVELTVGGGINRHLFAVLNTPNLKARSQPVLLTLTTPPFIWAFLKKTKNF